MLVTLMLMLKRKCDFQFWQIRQNFDFFVIWHFIGAFPRSKNQIESPQLLTFLSHFWTQKKVFHLYFYHLSNYDEHCFVQHYLYLGRNIIGRLPGRTIHEAPKGRIDRQTDSMTDGKTDRQTGRQTDRWFVKISYSTEISKATIFNFMCIPLKLILSELKAKNHRRGRIWACRACTLKRCVFHVYWLRLCHVTSDAGVPPPLYPDFTPNRNRLTDSVRQTAIGWRIVRSDGGGSAC